MSYIKSQFFSFILLSVCTAISYLIYFRTGISEDQKLTTTILVFIIGLACKALDVNQKLKDQNMRLNLKDDIRAIIKDEVSAPLSKEDIRTIIKEEVDLVKDDIKRLRDKVAEVDSKVAPLNTNFISLVEKGLIKPF